MDVFDLDGEGVIDIIYEDLDELFNVECWASKDGALLFMGSESKETTEVHFLQTADLSAPPLRMRLRLVDRAERPLPFRRRTDEFERGLELGSARGGQRWRQPVGECGTPPGPWS